MKRAKSNHSTFPQKTVVIGTVGSGKSTFAEKLVTVRDVQLVPADTLYQVNPFFERAIQDRKRWSLTSDLWFLKERVLIEKALNTSKPNIIDSGLAMSWIYAHSRIALQYYSIDEWTMYRDMYELLLQDIAPANCFVYLKSSTDSARKRMIQRGRQFEIDTYTQEYLLNLQKSIVQFVSQPAIAPRVIEVDVDSVDITDTKAMELIVKRMEEYGG